MLSSSSWQIVVIGAGASGLMAAGQAASHGAKVVVVDKMPKPGLKLGLTGKGRCNLTNTAPVSDFIAAFGSGGRFLRPAFSRFFAPDLRDFFHQLGVPTQEERGGRVFPESEDARLLVQALVDWVRQQGAVVQTRTRVQGLEVDQGRVQGVRVQTPDADSLIIPAEQVILATGGASYPGTGSTGDGYLLAQEVGHSLQPIHPALVPLEVEPREVVESLQGLSLRNVQVTAKAEGKTLGRQFGEMLFTHFGLSGPVILSLSQAVVRALEQKKAVSIHIDLKPALDQQKLDNRLIRDLRSSGRKQVKTICKGLLPQSLIPVCLHQAGLQGDKPGNQVSNRERQVLRTWLKDFQFTVTGHRSFKEAIVTAGGVRTKEVDPRSMESKLVSGLYLVGEVLDIAAITGGYNLQAAFSTGWLAGDRAGSRAKE